MNQVYIDCAGLSPEELGRAIAECLNISADPEGLEAALHSVPRETLVVLCGFDTKGRSFHALHTMLQKAEKKNADLHMIFDTPLLENGEWQAACEFTAIRRRYHVDHSLDRLESQVAQFVCANRRIYPTCALLVSAGEDYMLGNDPEAARIFFKDAEKCSELFDEVTLYLRLAQIHLEQGRQEEGVAYLIKLCTETVDNYEESIAFRDLTPVWENYKHLVEGLVPPSVSLDDTPRPLSPAECSRSIEEIFALPEDDILPALSDHLDELSGSGEALNCLNKWERNVYCLDELSMEVNSGGFDSYLFHRGEHFPKARKALKALDAPEMTALLDAVAAKFPRGKVPKSIDAIRNALEKLEDRGVDFEAEDDAYYNDVEQEFLPRLLHYILENRKHFR